MHASLACFLTPRNQGFLCVWLKSVLTCLEIKENMPALLYLSVLDNRPAASCKGTAAATYIPGRYIIHRHIPKADLLLYG
jgi:hypothetical protein